MILLSLMLLCSNVDECLSKCTDSYLVASDEVRTANCTRAIIFALKDLKEEIKAKEVVG